MASKKNTRGILVVAATAKELNPLLDIGDAEYGKLIPHDTYPAVDVLVTGVGVLPTVYHLTRALVQHSYDSILNTGLCGSYEVPPAPGEVVVVSEDRLYGLGAEGKDGFLTLRDIGLVKTGDPEDGFFNTPETLLPDVLKDLRRVKGITVNTIHSWSSSIKVALAVTGAGVESMEGAACMYVAARQQLPVIQLRAVSNMVGPREPEAWKIDEALDSLHHYTAKVLKAWS